MKQNYQLLNTGPSSFKLIQYNAYASTACLAQLHRYRYTCSTKLLCETGCSAKHLIVASQIIMTVILGTTG